MSTFQISSFYPLELPKEKSWRLCWKHPCVLDFAVIRMKRSSDAQCIRGENGLVKHNFKSQTKATSTLPWRNFIITVRSTVYTNPWQKRSFISKIRYESILPQKAYVDTEENRGAKSGSTSRKRCKFLPGNVSNCPLADRWTSRISKKRCGKVSTDIFNGNQKTNMSKTP